MANERTKATHRKVLIIESNKAATILLDAIVRSVDQDIQIEIAESLRSARAALLECTRRGEFELVILGMSGVASRSRLGFLSHLNTHHPRTQVVLMRNSKPRENTPMDWRIGKLPQRYLSLYLDLDQCRKLLERLLKQPIA